MDETIDIDPKDIEKSVRETGKEEVSEEAPTILGETVLDSQLDEQSSQQVQEQSDDTVESDNTTKVHIEENPVPQKITAEKYKPSPQEMVEAESRMSLEQIAQSSVRQIFIESEHRILELPEDLEYTYNSGYVVNESTIKGTFDGREVMLVQKSDNGLDGRIKLENIRTTGEVDGQEITKEEANSLWNDIHPVVLALEEYKKAEVMIVEKIREEIAKAKIRPEDIGPRERHQFRIRDKELAHELALKEEKKMTEVREILNDNIKKIEELSDDDKEFLERVREEIVKLLVLEYRSDESYLETETKPTGSVRDVLKIRSWDREGNPITLNVSQEYNRRKELLYHLLGVDKEKEQVWTAGFGVTYIDSKVYTTIFPEIILREDFDTEYQRVGAGSQIHIERNSRYAKTD